MASEEDFSLLAIAMVIIGLRIFIRCTQIGFSSWQLDDYLMPLVAVVFGVETVAAYYEGWHGLTNAAMTDEERAAIDFSSREYDYRRSGSKAQVLLWMLYVFILWGLKLCITVLCSRLTAGLPYLRHRIRFAYILIGATYLGVTSTMLLSCRPLSKFWQIKTDPGNSCQPAVSRIFVFVAGVPNVVTDIYLLSIPLPLLWKVNISCRRKIVLISLFSGAIFSIGMSIIRADVIMRGGPDVVVYGSLWACRETFVAIVVTNLPILHPLFKKCAERLGLGSIGVSCTSSSRSGSKVIHPLRGLSRRRHLTAKPLSDNTYLSTEQILADSEVQRQTDIASGLPANGIVVDQEIRITMEPAPTVKTKEPKADAPRDGSDVACDLDFVRSSRPLAPRMSARTVRIGSAIEMYK
ncbi:hypothetical protein F5Y13DRAFT_187237 [Hypoxylon sp. FL1857]|nr:hypothetical protein F5Y13DRAFT_187237 [Hypoxylon sp. FL1857]